jgi:hypothetical protein
MSKVRSSVQCVVSKKFSFLLVFFLWREATTQSFLLVINHSIYVHWMSCFVLKLGNHKPFFRLSLD